MMEASRNQHAIRSSPREPLLFERESVVALSADELDYVWGAEPAKPSMTSNPGTGSSPSRPPTQQVGTTQTEQYP